MRDFFPISEKRARGRPRLPLPPPSSYAPVIYAYFNPNFNRFRQVSNSNLSVRATLQFYLTFGVMHLIFQSGIYCQFRQDVFISHRGRYRYLGFAGSNLCMISIIGENYSELIVIVRSTKKWKWFSCFFAATHLAKTWSCLSCFFSGTHLATAWSCLSCFFSVTHLAKTWSCLSCFSQPTLS